MLTDTHVHFDGLLQAGDTIDAVVARAAGGGVSRMIAIGGSPAANRTALEIARAYPQNVRAAVGYNRDLAVAVGRQMTDGGRQSEEDAGRQTPDARGRRTDDERRMKDEAGKPLSEGGMIGELETLLGAPEVVAVGEIGLDFHHDRAADAAQIELFRRMLLLAREHRQPVCVHTREAEAETLSALRAHAAAWSGPADRIGVMHCFTGAETFARDLLALGFHISFSGILTFKNAGGLTAVAALVPEDRLLIETDSPYLAPEPFRGKSNEPARVRRVAEVLAAIRHTSWETIAELTVRNAARLFGRSE